MVTINEFRKPILNIPQSLPILKLLNFTFWFTLKKTLTYVILLLNHNEILALVDSGSTSSSFIDISFVRQFDIKVIPAKGEVSLANSSLTSKMEGECLISFTLNNRVCENVKVLVMGNLCADIILGQDFRERHKGVVFTFNGKEPTLQLCRFNTCESTPTVTIYARF